MGQRIVIPFGGCIPGPIQQTSAAAEGTTEAVVEINFTEQAETGNYWLDLVFVSINSNGQRDMQLVDPEGKSIISVSGEPILLRRTGWTTSRDSDRRIDGLRPTLPTRV